MADGEVTFELLLKKWQNMTAGDRKAILRAMTVEQRMALEEALSDEEEEEANAAIEFRGYSAWLAGVLKAQGCEQASSANSSSVLKPKVRETLDSIHHELLNESGFNRESVGLLARISRAWSSIGVRQ